MQEVFEAIPLEELDKVAIKIAEKTIQKKIVVIDGAMGAGKTTLISKICKLLQVEDEPSSPTFSIVNTYLSSVHGEIHHFDFYRIENEEEAQESGLEEPLYSGAICFIEWSEKIPNLLPPNYVKVKIEQTEDHKRTITIIE